MKRIPSHEQLIIFSNIAELGSFVKAGKKLGIPPTTVGRKLSELEQLLEVELFHRTTRQCRLSGEGEYYLDKFQSLILELEATTRFLNMSQEEPEGLLRITAPVPYGIYQLQPILTSFQQQYPQVAMQLFLKNEYVDLVREGFDLAIRVAPLRDSNLVARKIDSVAYRCVANKEYLSKNGALQTPDDLKKHRCVGLASGTGHVVWRLNCPTGDTEIDIDATFVVNDPIYALEIVKAGAGVAYLPDFIVQDGLKSGLIQEVLPGWKARNRDVFAVYHNRSLMPLALNKLLSKLTETLIGTD